MHLDDERIQRVLHDELAPAEKDAVARHLAECAACRARVEEARREEAIVFGLLRAADGDAPAIDAASVARRASARGTPAGARGGARAWQRRAAAILIATAAAGAAYAAPGSPLPLLVQRVAAWIAGGAPAPAPAPGPAPSPAPAPTEAPAPRGIAVAPSARFAIRFAAPQERGDVIVSLSPGANVVVRAVGGGAAFTTSAEALTIENSASTASYEIEIPAGAPWVSIDVGERRLFLKDGDRVAANGSADPERRYRLSLAAPAR